jgi:multidrug efflux pump subunit AcrA (membrane-fusion protein)
MPTTLQAHKEQHKLGWEITKYVISALIIGLGAGLMALLFALKKAPETQRSTALIQQVDVLPVEAYAGPLFLEVSGSVVPFREIRVASEVTGRVERQFASFENGHFVQRGEPLLQIETEAYELEIRTLEAEAVQAEKRIAENKLQMSGEAKNIQLAEADLALQTAELERNRRLGTALSQSELEQSLRAVNAAQIQLQTRQNNLAVMQASENRLEAALELVQRQLDRSKLNLRRTTIFAPAEGVIVRTLVREGDFVNPGSQVAIFEDISQAEIITNLTPSELKWIRDNAAPDSEVIENSWRAVYRIPKTQVTVFDPVDPQISWRGTLSRFDGIGRDDLTKTIPSRINVPQPIVETPTGPHALVRGMFVKCRMEVQVSANQLTLFRVPEVAIHPNSTIWLFDQGNLRQVQVKIVNRQEGEQAGVLQKWAVVSVEQGSLATGDRVVISPLSAPFSGMPVMLESKPTEISPAVTGTSDL